MAKRRSIGALIGTVLVAVAAAFAPVGSARADGCNIEDVWNAAVNTIAAIGSSACGTADENAELWIVVAGIAAATMVSAATATTCGATAA